MFPLPSVKILNELLAVSNTFFGNNVFVFENLSCDWFSYQMAQTRNNNAGKWVFFLKVSRKNADLDNLKLL